jgi:DNA-binding NarL/FixJ family response regulator
MILDTPASNTKAVKILIADDHPAVRDGLALRISQQPDLQVCGEASTIAEALWPVPLLPRTAIRFQPAQP